MDNLDALLNELHQTNVEILRRNQNTGAYNDYAPMDGTKLLETEIDPVPSATPTQILHSEHKPSIQLTKPLQRRNLDELNDMLNSLEQSDYSNLISNRPTAPFGGTQGDSPSQMNNQNTDHSNTFFVEAIHDHKKNMKTAAAKAAEQLDELLVSLGQFRLDEPMASSVQPSFQTNLVQSARPEESKTSGSLPSPNPPIPPRLQRKDLKRSTSPAVEISAKSSETDHTQEPSELLSNMMSTLSHDLAQKGAITSAKGFCSACEKPIVGMLISAMDKEWHPDHFTCTNCGVCLVRADFFERDNRPYCVDCHTMLFSPKCGYCEKAITDKCIIAMCRAWHPEHFFCCNCHQSFGSSVTVHEHENKVYCAACYLDLFGTRCAGCNLPISDAYITALDVPWHRTCFICQDCGRRLTGSNFLEVDGTPYCETHYYIRRGLVCTVCSEPITGRCVNALGRRYHPEHFQCAYCIQPLQTGTFKEHSKKPYCHQCFRQLFG